MFVTDSEILSTGAQLASRMRRDQSRMACLSRSSAAAIAAFASASEKKVWPAKPPEDVGLGKNALRLPLLPYPGAFLGRAGRMPTP